MAWRFKASKYKNAAPIAPKPDNTIRDLSIGSFMSHGNFIAASAAYMAFNWDTHGSNLAVLPIDAKGRQNKQAMPLIYAHPDFVTDFQFSPFDDGLLVTGSQDTTVKIWRIPEAGMPVGGIHNAEATLSPQPRRIDSVSFNPAADSVLATCSSTSVVVWDILTQNELFTFSDHEDDIQSVAWQISGQCLATQSRDRKLRIIDPRNPGGAAQECSSHEGIKDSRVVWLNDGFRVLTTGFSGDRLREINIRDIRNLNATQKNLQLDMSAGILVPLYDPDTGMCLLCGKGDRNIQFVEITNTDPYIIEGLKYSGELTKGACLVPKRAMHVMQGEVNRVLQLCSSSIVPVAWQVPRKSYREYHADIYPETNGYEAAMGPTDWSEGKNVTVPKINLDPKKRPKDVLTVFQGPLGERKASIHGIPSSTSTKGVNGASSIHGNGDSAANGSAEKIQQLSSSPLQANCSPFTKPIPPSTKPSPPSTKPSPPLTKPSPPLTKPSPRPRTRGVVRSYTASTSDSPTNGTKDSPEAKPKKLESPFINPRPHPRLSSSASVEENGTHTMKNGNSVGTGNGSINDNGDEGLAALRRQPSIRDRKKLFEDSIRKNQKESTNGTRNGSGFKPPVIARKPSIVDEQTDKMSFSDHDKENKVIKEEPEPTSAPVLRKKKPSAVDNVEEKPAKRPVSRFFGRVSKFKHLKGDIILKGKFENLKNLSRTVPAECNFFHANPVRLAVPITGPGGKVAIFETKKPGRIPDGVMPVIINGSTVMDFCFDPFDNSRLLTGCDDGYVRVWKIPENGLAAQTNEPKFSFPAHGEKIQIVKFHPLAKDVLLTSAFDKTVKLWDLSSEGEERIDLNGHTEQLFGVDWSPCGKFLATVCKDGKIRIYDPRKSSDPFIEGGDIVAKKGARILWVLDGEYLIVTGFSKQSERQVMIFQSSDLVEVNTVVLDVSPTILIPHYDEDSSTLFVFGKGESTVNTFEVSRDAPHLFALSPYKAQGLHQGFAFLPKIVCNVRDVEFSRAYRITDNTIEPISFTVPRVRTAFFQDDLFPPTRILWEPTVSSTEWYSGSSKEAERMDLMPKDMRPLSGNRPVSTVVSTRSQIVSSTPDDKKDKSLVGNWNHMTNEISDQMADTNVDEDKDDWE